MTPFFRRIRRKLADDNQFLKYSRYAIGEIALVVVGILIALSINNWNENRKQQIVLNSYYKQILNDLEREKNYTQELISFLNKTTLSFEAYMKVFEESNLGINDIIGLISKVDYESKYLEFNTNTIQTLQNTGEIKFLPEDLRNKIITLKRFQDRLTSVSNGNNKIYLNSFMIAAQLGYNDILGRAQNHPELLKDLNTEINLTKVLLAVEPAFRLKYFTESELKGRLNVMMDDIREIEELIDLEIKLE